MTRISQSIIARRSLIIYLDEYQQSSINFCDDQLPPDSNAYGDWIYLNGTQNVLIEYQVTLYHQKPYLLM